MDPTVPTLPSGPVPTYPPNGGSSPVNDGSLPTNPPPPPSRDLSVAFQFLCSNIQTEDSDGNLLSYEAVKILIVKTPGAPALCEVRGDFKQAILNTKRITFKPCDNLPAGDYTAYLVDEKMPLGDGAAIKKKTITKGGFPLTIHADGNASYKGAAKIGILYDLNQGNSSYNRLNREYGKSNAVTQAACENQVSPLIISLSATPRSISLTAPLEGIQFDILGMRSFPRPHDKKQISWLTQDPQEYYFLTLPNSRGEVLGIEQMFGDNTAGPDGTFAPNGYAALAKYDEDGDHLITPYDPVFEKLRLWDDRNRDGLAQPEELLKLKDKSIQLIDLRFDDTYEETDRYGNQTLMKSVVKTEDGHLHLIFDLWFRYLNITR